MSLCVYVCILYNGYMIYIYTIYRTQKSFLVGVLLFVCSSDLCCLLLCACVFISVRIERKTFLMVPCQFVFVLI